MTLCMCALPVDRLVDRRVRLAEPALAGGVHGEPCALRTLGVDAGMCRGEMVRLSNRRNR